MSAFGNNLSSVLRTGWQEISLCFFHCHFESGKHADFTIGEVEQFRRLKAHTLRMREERHCLVSPGHRNGMDRSYSTDELEDLFSICLLKCSGHRISVIAAMTNAKQNHAVTLLKEGSQRKERDIYILVMAMYRLNTDLLCNTLEECFLS